MRLVCNQSHGRRAKKIFRRVAEKRMTYRCKSCCQRSVCNGPDTYTVDVLPVSSGKNTRTRRCCSSMTSRRPVVKGDTRLRHQHHSSRTRRRIWKIESSE